MLTVFEAILKEMHNPDEPNKLIRYSFPRQTGVTTFLTALANFKQAQECNVLFVPRKITMRRELISNYFLNKDIDLISPSTDITFFYGQKKYDFAFLDNIGYSNPSHKWMQALEMNVKEKILWIDTGRPF